MFIAVLFAIPLWGKSQQKEPLDNQRLMDYYQNQQYRQAAVYLRGFYDESRPDRKLMERLGYCYRMAGNDRQAEYFYTRLYQLDSLHIPTLLNLAAINTKRLYYTEAVDFLERVVEIDSTHVAALISLSGLSGQLHGAESQYPYLKRAHGLQPGNADIAYDFADLCMQIEAYGEADTVLREALEIDPGNRSLLLARAKVTNHLKDYKETIRLARQLLDQDYQSTDLLILLSRAYFFEKQYKECIGGYQQIMGDGLKLGEVDLYYLAMAHKAEKQYKEGISVMEQVLEAAISPNTAFYYGSKASLHDLANQPSASVQDYLRSFRFDIIPSHYYSLALVYDVKLNDPRNALRYYKTYLEQDLPAEEQRYVEYVKRRIKELERK